MKTTDKLRDEVMLACCSALSATLRGDGIRAQKHIMSALSAVTALQNAQRDENNKPQQEKKVVA